MNNQYINYNVARVIICNEYTITNIQTKGLPDKDCGCHLESLDINTSVVGSNNPEDVGAYGSISVIDYKDSVLSKLINTLKTYIAHKNDNDSTPYLPTVQIDVECFTGTKTWKGHILNWQLSFVGTTPSLVMQWKEVVPNTVKTIPMPYYSHWNDPVKLISKLSQLYNPHIPMVDPDGKEISAGKLKFINENGLDLSMSGLPSCGNREIDIYFIIAQNSKFNGKLVTGKYNKEQNKFSLVYRQADENDTKTEDGNVSNKLIFIQNGAYKPYQARDVDNRIVIPMTSFNFNLDMNKLVLASRVIENKNGTMVLGTYGEQFNTTTQPEAKNVDGSKADAAESGAIEVTFDCYNVMTFSQNNLSEPVEYEIYNEFGQKHISTGRGTVKSCKYTIGSSSVVKASITCTEIFNSSMTDVQKDSSEKDSSKTTSTSKEPPNENMKHIVSDGTRSISVLNDKTELCISNGTFALQVSEFIDRYGDLSGDSRLLDYEFVHKVVKSGNFGLLSLLIAVANYGVKNIPKTAGWNEDPVIYVDGFTNKKPFCASTTGKTPYDYKVGGLGIAHWDAENLQNIYTTVGFNTSMSEKDKEALSKIFIDNPPSNKQDYTGKCIGWKLGTFKGISRLFPVFEKKSWIRRFDDGLKKDKVWLNWANSILCYNRGGDNRPYQSYLFELWVKEFWTPAKTAVLNSNTPILQDVIRISRITNSYKGLRNKLTDKSVEEQLNIYVAQRPGKSSRYIRQFAFCQRACLIAEYEHWN